MSAGGVGGSLRACPCCVGSTSSAPPSGKTASRSAPTGRRRRRRSLWTSTKSTLTCSRQTCRQVSYVNRGIPPPLCLEGISWQTTLRRRRMMRCSWSLTVGHAAPLSAIHVQQHYDVVQADAPADFPDHHHFQHDNDALLPLVIHGHYQGYAHAIVHGQQNSEPDLSQNFRCGDI
jgi:hypothetical protein